MELDIETLYLYDGGVACELSDVGRTAYRRDLSKFTASSVAYENAYSKSIWCPARVLSSRSLAAIGIRLPAQEGVTTALQARQDC